MYWNIPSELCKARYNISFAFAADEFGISMNDDDKFRGDAITILYNPGLFPEIKGYKYNPALKNPDLSKLEFINGGLPQNGNMLRHLEAFEDYVNEKVPNKKNDGNITFYYICSIGEFRYCSKIYLEFFEKLSFLTSFEYTKCRPGNDATA